MIDIMIASHFTQTRAYAAERRGPAGKRWRLWRLARLQTRRIARRRRLGGPISRLSSHIAEAKADGAGASFPFLAC